ncbi:DUF4198 domain-containing protein [Paraglaciecola sp.]|uniref:DUF4198 domain-containing protein n=1 Tax=Paraglaciecola sp. TaxID=1920173 RepID=UPI0030F415D0
MRFSKSLRGLTLSTVFLACAPAYSHTPYFAPSTFDVSKSGKISLDASFAERFFVPEVAFNNSIFNIVSPNGQTISPDTVAKLTLRTAVEHTLVDDGTYRFSTGKRLGRIFKAYELDGKKITMENPEDPIPAGGKLLSFFQSLTLAETYVSKGAPNNTALAAYNEGLEFVALTHPNELFIHSPVKLQSKFNGAVLADQNIDIYLAQYQFSDEKPLLTVTSNPQGEFSFIPEKPGNYLLRARYRSKAPAAAAVPEISNTYTLVLEVVE